VLGVVALVFLIIGYQTAMFVYKAAVTKIAANRDEPDTVYVYQTQDVISPGRGQIGGNNVERRDISQSGKSYSSTSVSLDVKENSTRYVRRNAEHSPVAEAVRQNVPRRRVESFRFNPNTASVEELCRLGFTLKQAQSIDKYRQKGGRFARKDDFAESFVVSDSIYRRLESFIDIPLTDLNTADSAEFDALPGIGGWFASEIIKYRKALCGYSYKEQLMDIYRFDQEKFDALKDLITVSEEYVTAYPLWTLPSDSLSLHPYIADRRIADDIILFRQNNPKSHWTVEELKKAGVLHPDHAFKLERCHIRQP
jgi:DNA uptake protein ComE-like DNA-binding protein